MAAGYAVEPSVRVSACLPRYIHELLRMRAFPFGVFDPRLSMPGPTLQSGSTSSAEGERAMGKKARKPITTKEPPVPTDSHAEIEDWIRRVMPDLHPVVKRLDELICEAIPGLQYAVKWKKAYYGLPELGWIIEMVAYDVSANVVFFGGADFDPPPPLGTTDRSRYIKVKTLEEAQGPEMHKWVEQAGRVPGWK
jgi:hypothetical protein